MPVANRLVSLIMCAWRPHAAWLREAVAGALAQRDCDVELVLIDDGSPEPVASLLGEVNDPRLRIIRIAHVGLSGARNAGTAAARGAYLRFIDADDLIAPDSTAALLGAMSDSVGIAYSGTAVCDEELRPVTTRLATIEGDVAVPCLLGQFGAQLPSILFDRRVAEAVGPWNAALEPCEDYDFVLRAVAMTRVRAVGGVASFYRRHNASITRTTDLATSEAAWRGVIDGYFARSPGLRGSALQRRAEAVLLLERARAYAQRGATAAALKRLFALARCDPLGAARAVPALVRLRLAALRKRPVAAR